MANVVDITGQTDPSVHGGRMAKGDPKGIVLHHTGSRGEDGDIWWLSHAHPNPVSINQLIKRDGTIVQIVPNDGIAWHAGTSVLNGRADCNSWCIGIEICNAGDGTELYTDAQYEAVAQTIAYNCVVYRIPDRNVSSHARVALPPGRKNDPINWDWLRMWRRVDDLRDNWPFAPLANWSDHTGCRIMSTE